MNQRTTMLAILLSVFSIGSAMEAANAAGPGGGPGFNLYFGDLHAHTRFSDGWEGTPEDAYVAAREAGADYMATTDHNFMLTQDEWSLTLLFAEEQTSARFAAIPASEYWIANGFGEVAVFNVEELRTKANFRGPDNNPLSRHEVIPAFYDFLAAQPGAVGLWVHPGIYGDLDEFEHWTETRDEAMSLLEIHNYGSFLGAPANWGVYDYEQHFLMALEKGWHVMPAANSDTHSPDWISGAPVRTVLLARKPTPDELYAAMRARRGYATLDENLRIDYRLNGEVMGSILSASTGVYTAEIHIEDPDGSPEDVITQVEIVSNQGEVVASTAGGDTVFDWSVRLDSETARYYYVRVSTASALTGGDGVTAWTAPVWTGR